MGFKLARVAGVDVHVDWSLLAKAMTPVQDLLALHEGSADRRAYAG